MSRALRVVFAGTPDFAVVALRSIYHSAHRIVQVICQPDRPAGRGRKLRACAVKQAAQDLQLPLHQPESICANDSVQFLRSLQPDVIVVAAYGQILSAKVLAVPKLACLNIHASLLPRWRGAAPIQRAILHGDDETGVTIMHMAEKLDAGDIIEQVTCPLLDNDTALSVHDRLADMGATALLHTLECLARERRVNSFPQDEQLVTYAAKITKQEAELDWSIPMQKVQRRIRALYPIPIAYTWFDQHRLKIYAAHPLPEDFSKQTTNKAPGSIVVQSGRLCVRCGDGWLQLDELQLEGSRRMSAREFLNAQHGLEVRALRMQMKTVDNVKS